MALQHVERKRRDIVQPAKSPVRSHRRRRRACGLPQLATESGRLRMVGIVNVIGLTDFFRKSWMSSKPVSPDGLTTSSALPFWRLWLPQAGRPLNVFFDELNSQA
jgi:hypothetical protein